MEKWVNVKNILAWINHGQRICCLSFPFSCFINALVLLGETRWISNTFEEINDMVRAQHAKGLKVSLPVWMKRDFMYVDREQREKECINAFLRACIETKFFPFDLAASKSTPTARMTTATGSFICLNCVRLFLDGISVLREEVSQSRCKYWLNRMYLWTFCTCSQEVLIKLPTVGSAAY